MGVEFGQRRHLSRHAAAMLVAAASIALAGCASLLPGGEPRYEVCREQVLDHVSENFQQRVTEIDMTFAERRPVRITTPPETGRAVVYVAECDGYHVFDVYGTDYDCRYRAHYGKPPVFVRYRTSSGECRR